MGAALFALFVAFSPAPSMWACDPDAVEWVAFSPPQVEVLVGGQADVSVVVRCRTNGGDFVDNTRAEFEIRLVSEDDEGQAIVLGQHLEAFTIPTGRGFRVPHTAQMSFTLACASGRSRLVNRPSPGGATVVQLQPNEALHLALQIDNGPNEETQVYFPTDRTGATQPGVTANCVQGLSNQSEGAGLSEQARALIQKSGNAFSAIGADLMLSPSLFDNMLNGAYPANLQVLEDESGQRKSISLPQSVLVEIRAKEVTIQGGKDWVTLRGLLSQDGSLVARGTGAVAGVAEVEVVFRGTLTHGELRGEYVIGERASLPNGKPIVYWIEARSSRWSGFWEQFSPPFASAAETAGTLSVSTLAIGVDFRESMSTLTAALLKADADARFGTSEALGRSLAGIADSLGNVADVVFVSDVANKSAIGREIDQASKLVAKAAESYGRVLEASIFVESVSMVTVESAIDTDNNNRINDNEIVDAIRFWIRQERVPGTTQFIDDSEITVLVELWILGRLIETSTASEQNSALAGHIAEMLEHLSEAGARLNNAGDLLMGLAS